ncbi:hypothetical protein [Bradyrhizobium japonicum]|uniref:hypothetical protein n=1 Tax=Bradyrhizobium japonicum TaxID=375 RepID=UPI000AF09FF4|nr:hypothetical protein [Bradyrhizobium japonicum]
MALRRVADQLLDKAEQGNLAYIHELIDRLDGKAVQVVDQRDVPIEQLSDAELYRIAASGKLAPEMEMLLLPPAKVRSEGSS